MSTLNDITDNILQQMPPNTRFREEDAQIIQKHHAQLAALEDKLVQGFYDMLFEHPPTNQIFIEGERPAREETLRVWWRRTLDGPFDSNYWNWQALVGLIHVKRKVKNPMMIAMWGWILTTIKQELAADLEADALNALQASFVRLAATVQSLTAESYLEHYIKALQGATGFKPGLLERLVANEVDDLLAVVGHNKNE